MEQSQLLYDGDSPTGQCAWGGEESGTIVWGYCRMQTYVVFAKERPFLIKSRCN
jgi:hypothetical protein